jgi:hypothetical protein
LKESVDLLLLHNTRYEREKEGGKRRKEGGKREERKREERGTYFTNAGNKSNT